MIMVCEVLVPATVKIAPEIDAKLYEEMVAVAKKYGVKQRYVLERALEHYLHNVVPSQNLVRQEVMDLFQQAVKQNRELLERLAK